MSTQLPANRIKKVKLPDNTEYTIVPEILQNNGYQASLPTLNADDIILTADTNQSNLEGFKHFDGARGGGISVEDHGYFRIALEDTYTGSGHDKAPLNIEYIPLEYAGFLTATDSYSGRTINLSIESVQEDESTYNIAFPGKSGTVALTSDVIEVLITPITYDELKALRDNNELIPGMQYRITDYSCTTTQFDTRSAGHNFDIIVTADSTHTLNENARACVNANDTTYFKKASGADWINPRPTPVFSYWLNTDEDTGYGKVPPAEQGPVHGTAQIITEYTKINYNGRELPAMFNPDPETTTFTNSVVSVQYVVKDDEHSYEGSTEYKPNDAFCELGYVEVDNTTYPVLYKNDIRYFGYNNVDHDDVFRYDGDYTLDGTVYSRWKKYEDSNFNTYSGIDVLTQRIVVNNEFTITQEQLTAGITVSHESSENDLYYVYDGTETIMEGVENTLCHALYAVNEDGEEVYADGSYKVEDTFVEISYETVDGVLTPVMYKNDLWDKAYVEEGTDYGDVFVYIGNLTVDGTTYNRWRKYEHGNIDPSDYTGFDVLTEVIVVNNQFTISQQEFTDAIQYTYVTYDKWKCLHASDLSPENGWYLTNKLVDNVYTESNLNTWELKYSLDNDTKRFGWALDGQQIVYNDVIYDRSSDNDNTNDNPDFTGYQIGWKSNDSSHNILYSPSEIISSDDGLFNPVEEAVIFQPDYSVHTGKGVIYYMKDEWNNECAYDFKNIQFKRKLSDGQYDTQGENTWVYTFNAYDLDNSVHYDATKINNEYCGSDSALQCSANEIKERRVTDYYDSTYPVRLLLNNNVFLNKYSVNNDDMFLCVGNKLDVNCQQNTFDNGCKFNRLGADCYGNVMRLGCSYNIFENECLENILGTDCSYNIFENYCNNNELSYSCSHNVFNTYAYDNLLNQNSNYNVFGIRSNGNQLNNNCYYINIGDGTSYAYFGNNFFNINIGKGCGHIVFGTSTTSRISYCKNITIDNGCLFLNITCADTSEGSNNQLQNIHIHTGVSGTGTDNMKSIVVEDRNLSYETNYYANGTKDIII